MAKHQQVGRRQSKRKPVLAPARPSRDYERARQAAAAGEYATARLLYESVAASNGSAKLKGLAHCDLAALAAMEGDTDAARNGFMAALAIDPQCEAAQHNLAVLDAGQSDAISDVRIAEDPPRQTPGVERCCRVAIVSLLFNWPTSGGGNVHTAELAKFLAKAGYEVRHFFARFEPWGIGRIDSPPPFSSEALDFPPGAWTAETIQSRFREAVRSFNPDHVVISDSWNFKPLLAEAVQDYPFILRLQALECLCPLNNVRLLPDGEQCPRHQFATPDACRRCLDQRGQWSGVLHRAERELSQVGSGEYDRKLRWAFERAEAVLVVNPLVDAMVSPYASKVRVAPSGFDPERFPWPWPHEAGARNGDGKNKTSIFIAALVDEAIKGYHVLHAACRQLWTKRQDFELVATGNPAGQIDEFTRYVGWQSQQELPRHMRMADIVVVPAIAQEALGRTAVEAMGVGRPVIASRIGGLPYTIADGAGLLVAPGDVGDMIQKLELLLDDPRLREQLGAAGRRRFENCFQWQSVIEQHYQPLLGPARTRQPARAAPPYQPVFRDWIDEERLLDDVCDLSEYSQAQVVERFARYREFHESQDYARTLGERKTLTFEETFVISVLAEKFRLRTIVELGVQSGKSTRRILDLQRHLRLSMRVVCFDLEEQLSYFTPDEAQFVQQDVTGRFRQVVLDAYEPDLIFLDLHAYPLLREAIEQTIHRRPRCVLVIHDCGRGLCNPRMSVENGDPITSSTGVWERHVLAKLFEIEDPLDTRLDRLETATHRLRIVETTHGLAVIVPRTDGDLAFPDQKRVTERDAFLTSSQKG